MSLGVESESGGLPPPLSPRSHLLHRALFPDHLAVHAMQALEPPLHHNGQALVGAPHGHLTVQHTSAAIEHLEEVGLWRDSRKEGKKRASRGASGWRRFVG